MPREICSGGPSVEWVSDLGTGQMLMPMALA
jgi:hypothetical protein